jgi:AraC-like DNA-binding protein
MVMDPPWCLRIEDEAPITLMALVRGQAWVVPDGQEAVRRGSGDVVIARGPDHYTVADDPESPPQIVIHPGQRCTTLGGFDLAEAMKQGVRTWGNSANGQVVMLVGTYEEVGEISQRLLDSLPTLLTITRDEWDSPLIPLLGREIVKDDPGQEAVLDRMLDLLLIAALRTWFARHDTEAPAWYRAHGDPVVGRALALLHNNPSYPWTVSTLAAETGVSRATLARRFAELVGEPPMSFLTGWRLALAADLLRQPDTTIGAVAHQVGYSSPFALSTAFKRAYGVSPQQHRLGAAPASPSARL